MGGSIVRIVLNLQPNSLYDSIHELMRMAYPGCEIACTEGPGISTST